MPLPKLIFFLIGGSLKYTLESYSISNTTYIVAQSNNNISGTFESVADSTGAASLPVQYKYVFLFISADINTYYEYQSFLILYYRDYQILLHSVVYPNISFSLVSVT